MEPCLLCLDIKDVLDCIRANSTQWKELNITKTVEKHFWSLNTIQPNSCLCLSCWREVYTFHKFFLRIEEVHVNLSKIKVEDCTVLLECKEELTIQQPNVKDNDRESDKGEGFCYLEPEILIDQTQQQNLSEPEILLDKRQPGYRVDKNTVITDSLNEVDLNDIYLRRGSKRLRLQSDLAKKDPLEKSNKSKRKKNHKEKVGAEKKLTDNLKLEQSKIKEEPVDSYDSNDSDSKSYNDNDPTDVSYEPNKVSSETAESKRSKTCNKHAANRKENDKFIAEHFKQMFCDLCQVQFENFSVMQKHFSEIHNQRGYVVCCKKKFSYRTHLVDHLHCHLNPDHFKCNECNKTMSDRISFDSHMLRVHRAKEAVKQHFCDICGKSFTESYVLIHKLTHLPEEEKKFPCSDCGKNYGSPYLLNQHRQSVHLKRFAKICYICGKAINSSAEFKAHMNKHEGIPLPVINCDICGLRLTSERGLKLHKDSQHPVGGKKEHHCPICPKISPTLKALRKHINTMHKKGYDHKCSICEKAFKRTEALREHMATHTGTALYTCPWCPKTFNSNGNMHAHRKKVHPKEWEESKLQKYSGNIPPEI